MVESGLFTHISGHPSAEGRACDRESSPAKTEVLATATPFLVIKIVIILRSKITLIVDLQCFLKYDSNTATKDAVMAVLMHSVT